MGKNKEVDQAIQQLFFFLLLIEREKNPRQSFHAPGLLPLFNIHPRFSLKSHLLWLPDSSSSTVFFFFLPLPHHPSKSPCAIRLDGGGWCGNPLSGDRQFPGPFSTSHIILSPPPRSLLIINTSEQWPDILFLLRILSVRRHAMEYWCRPSPLDIWYVRAFNMPVTQSSLDLAFISVVCPALTSSPAYSLFLLGCFEYWGSQEKPLVHCITPFCFYSGPSLFLPL